MNWSKEQTDIFDWFKSAQGALVVKARAGTGKTTTIKAAFEHAPEARILYAVFNKKNQIEAQEKIKDPRVEVKTLHSLGFAFIKRIWRNARPEPDVETDRVNSCANFEDCPEERAAVIKLVSFAKNTCIAPLRPDLERICQEQDIEFQRLDGIDIALRAIERAKQQDSRDRISFDDMVWLPVAMGCVRPWYGLVCIDEAQDMNMPQLMMARGAVMPGGRIVVIGDDRQAIYGFRGAVQGAMTMMKIQLHAQELGLKTTYRCPKSVVRLAQEIVPDYCASDSAPEGEVSPMGDISRAQPGDAILSRLNAPLMPLALGLIRNGVPARIEGRDLGKQLSQMARTMKAKSVPHFIERVGSWLQKTRKRLENTKHGKKRMEQSDDIAQTLIALAENASGVPEIETRISGLFDDTTQFSKPAVVLSSVHKAKGLEWKRVFILSETFRRGKGIEEDNIFYVAITRAMCSLFIVGNVSTGGVGGPAVASAEIEPVRSQDTIKDGLADNIAPAPGSDSSPVAPAAIVESRGIISTPENQETKRPIMEPVGKIEFIDHLILEGGKTKVEIHDLAKQRFPDLSDNTVNWCVSTMIQRLGKIPRHKAVKRKGRGPNKPKTLATAIQSTYQDQNETDSCTNN